MTKIKARCIWSPHPPFFFELQRDIITKWTVYHMSAIVPSFWRKNFVFSCIWGEFLALVKLMGILPLPCQAKISHMKRKIIKKTPVQTKNKLERSLRKQISSTNGNSPLSFIIYIWSVDGSCNLWESPSAVSCKVCQDLLSVWVFFYKNIWLPSPSKYHYFS